MNTPFVRFNPAKLSLEAMRGLANGVEREPSKHFLLPGQMFASREATTITTILGSCVAICLWDSRNGFGGMNHYLLPEGQDNGPNRLRYGNVANPALLKQMLSFGCNVRDLQARIFGGASTFSGVNPDQSLGKRNIELAVEFLREANVLVVTKEVSNTRGCKLVFQTVDGSAVVKSFEDK